MWREAIELYAFVKTKIRSLKEIPYKVRAQVEDSAFSYPSNIAEGYGRRGLKENIQFNTIALSSLAENYTQIVALYEGGDIEKSWFDKYDTKHYSLENKLINYNRSQIKKLTNNSEWRNDYVVKELIESYRIKDV